MSMFMKMAMTSVGVGTIFDFMGAKETGEAKINEIDIQQDSLETQLVQDKLEVEQSVTQAWSTANKAVGTVWQSMGGDSISSNSSSQLFEIGSYVSEAENNARQSEIMLDLNYDADTATNDMKKWIADRERKQNQTSAIFSGITTGLLLKLK